MRCYLITLTSARPHQRVYARQVYADGPGRACSMGLGYFVEAYPEVHAGDMFVSARDLGPATLHAVDSDSEVAA